MVQSDTLVAGCLWVVSLRGGQLSLWWNLLALRPSTYSFPPWPHCCQNEECSIGLQLSAQRPFRGWFCDLIKVSYTEFQRERNVPLKSHEARGRSIRQKDCNQGLNHCSWPTHRGMTSCASISSSVTWELE